MNGHGHSPPESGPVDLAIPRPSMRRDSLRSRCEYTSLGSEDKLIEVHSVSVVSDVEMARNEVCYNLTAHSIYISHSQEIIRSSMVLFRRAFPQVSSHSPTVAIEQDLRSALHISRTAMTLRSGQMRMQWRIQMRWNRMLGICLTMRVLLRRILSRVEALLSPKDYHSLENHSSNLYCPDICHQAHMAEIDDLEAGSTRKSTSRQRT